MVLRLRLLGDFSVVDASGKALSLPTRKTAALLAYLAVNADRPQPRERLMALLWSDRDDRHARQSLNHALLSIRKLAGNGGPPILDSNGEQVTLRGDAVEIDVARFRDALAGRPMAAVDLYAGPFLDGLTVPDPAFDEWLAVTRAECHTQLCDALEQAIDAAAEDDPGGAIELTRRLIRLDPVRESGHQHLMRLLYERGDRASALRQYRDCADILEKELAVEPGAATRALFEAINRDDVAPVTMETLATVEPPAVATSAVPLRAPAVRTGRYGMSALAALAGVVIGAGAVSLYDDGADTRQAALNARVAENARALAAKTDREAALQAERNRAAALTLERAVEAARNQAAETARQHAEGVVQQHAVEIAREQAEALLREAQEAVRKQVAEIVRRAKQDEIAKAAERAKAQKQLAAVPFPPARPARSGSVAMPRVEATKEPVGQENVATSTTPAEFTDLGDPALDMGFDAGHNVVIGERGDRSGKEQAVATIDFERDRETIEQAIFDYYYMYGYPNEKTDNVHLWFYGTVMREINQVTVDRIHGSEVDVSAEYIASGNLGMNRLQRRARFRLEKQDESISVVKMWGVEIVEMDAGKPKKEPGATERKGIVVIGSNSAGRATDQDAARRDAIVAAVTDYFFVKGYPSEGTGYGRDIFYGWEVPGVRLVAIRKTRDGVVDALVEAVASVVDNYQAPEGFRRVWVRLRDQDVGFTVIKSWDADQA